MDEGQYIAGVTVVSAPVWKGAGRPVHALVAIGIGAALGRELGALQDALVEAAGALSGQLGGA